MGKATSCGCWDAGAGVVSRSWSGVAAASVVELGESEMDVIGDDMAGV